MARSKDKKAGKKKKRRSPTKTRSFVEQLRGPPHAGVGDLRLVRQHIDAYRGGEVAALEVLTSLGRDAAFPALKYAEALGDAELIEHARRLVAVTPAVQTNLYELREAAVDAIIERGRLAPELGTGPAATAKAGLALFDPAQVKQALARGGRPRRELEQERAGVIAVLGLATAESVAVRLALGAPAAGQATTRRRLKVGSGVVVIAPPEASDGPRLGTVRLDPERTALDDFFDAGTASLVRIVPGIYTVEAFYSAPSELSVHVHPDREPQSPLPFEADSSLAAIPGL